MSIVRRAIELDARVAIPLGKMKAWTESWDAEVELPRPTLRKLE